MTTIADVRAGLAAAVTEGTKNQDRPDGLHCDEYLLDMALNPPYAEIVRREMDPRYVFSGAKAQYQFTVRTYWPITNERAAQVEMDELCDPLSTEGIVAAIETGANWPSEIVDYAQVTLVGEQVVVERAGVPYFMVPFDVEVVF